MGFSKRNHAKYQKASNDDNNAAIHGFYGFGGLKIACIFVTMQKIKLPLPW